MTTAEAWKLLLTALGWFGGGAVVTIAIAGFVSKLMADRSIEKHKAALGRETERLKAELAKETETHKLKLKKQEMLFAQQVKATSDFIELGRKIRPGYDWPDKDWDEACQELVPHLGSVEKQLEAFHQKNGPVLDADARKMLKECISLASNNKFAGDGPAYGSFDEAMKAANDILNKLEELEEHLLQQVQK